MTNPFNDCKVCIASLFSRDNHNSNHSLLMWYFTKSSIPDQTEKINSVCLGFSSQFCQFSQSCQLWFYRRKNRSKSGEDYGFARRRFNISSADLFLTYLHNSVLVMWPFLVTWPISKMSTRAKKKKLATSTGKDWTVDTQNIPGLWQNIFYNSKIETMYLNTGDKPLFH